MKATLTANVSEVLGCWADEGQHLLACLYQGQAYLVHAEPTDTDDDPPEGAEDSCLAYALHVRRLDGSGDYAETGPAWSDKAHPGHLLWLLEQAEDAGLFEEANGHAVTA